MKRAPLSTVRSQWLTNLLVVAILLQPDVLPAEPVAVRYKEGSLHGFLVLRTMEGKILASGDLTQSLCGDNVVSSLIFRFRDGSIDEETVVFSQRGSFRLISNHRIQKARRSLVRWMF